MLRKLLVIITLLNGLNNFAQGNVPETIETDFWLGNNWIFVTETNYTFNSNCLPLVGISKAFNFSTNELDDISRITNTYNDDDEIIIGLLFELWNEDIMDWENSTRVVIDLDGNNLLESITYNWIGNTWIPATRTTGNYDNNFLAESITEDWNSDNNNWINNERSTYEYNANNLPEIDTIFTWSNNDWLEEKRSISEYNPNGSLSTNTRYSWDVMTSNWVNDDRTLFTYNTAYFLIEQERQDWDILTETWVENHLDESIYDANDNVEESINSEWNETTMMYEPKTRSLRTHNAEGFPIEVISQNFVGVWVNSTRTHNTYPPCATLSNTISEIKTEIKVYPNPTTEFLNIDFKNEGSYTISIYDLNGKQLFNRISTAQNFKLNVAHFSKGIYILKISNSSKNTAHKLIIN